MADSLSLVSCSTSFFESLFQPAVGDALCWVCSFDSSLRAVGYALVTFVPAVGFALLILFTISPLLDDQRSSASAPSLSTSLSPTLRVELLCFFFTRIRSSECRRSLCRRPSPSCGVRQSDVASFFFLVTTGAVGRGSFSVLCLNSLPAHRDLSPAALCGSLRLRGALLASSNTTIQHCATS